jgi:hypothetical protein
MTTTPAPQSEDPMTPEPPAPEPDRERTSGVLSDFADAVQVWPLARILTAVTPGSGDWTWPEEMADLANRHPQRLADLQADLAANGITTPVHIGSDGRLWDGHHRITVAHRLGIGYIPVLITDGGREQHTPLRDRIAEAITYHPGNRGAPLERRELVSQELADAVMAVVGPELARTEAELARLREQLAEVEEYAQQQRHRAESALDRAQALHADHCGALCDAVGLSRDLDYGWAELIENAKMLREHAAADDAAVVRVKQLAACMRTWSSSPGAAAYAQRIEEALAGTATMPLQTDRTPEVAALGGEQSAPDNPPGSRTEVLPADQLAAIGHLTELYVSTACDTASSCHRAAVPRQGLDDAKAAELEAVADRLHSRCRLTHKFTGQKCVCWCHHNGGERP